MLLQENVILMSELVCVTLISITSSWYKVFLIEISSANIDEVRVQSSVGAKQLNARKDLNSLLSNFDLL